jgi:hypothetical protein
MNKVLMLLALPMLAGCQDDMESVGDPARKPQTTTASVQTYPLHPPSSVSSTQGDNSDTAQWQEVRNKWGWKIKFPKTWEAFAASLDDRETVETSEGPTMYGRRIVTSRMPDVDTLRFT